MPCVTCVEVVDVVPLTRATDVVISDRACRRSRSRHKNKLGPSSSRCGARKERKVSTGRSRSRCKSSKQCRPALILCVRSSLLHPRVFLYLLRHPHPHASAAASHRAEGETLQEYEAFRQFQSLRQALVLRHGQVYVSQNSNPNEPD